MKKLVLGVLALAALFLIYTFAVKPLLDEWQKPDTADTEEPSPVGPAFNADSAYAFCAAQCNFGPRAMNTEGHERCGEWIIQKFRSYGCKVITQHADLKGYDGTTLKAMNIMARYRPELTTRILLCAHWDSRPWADNDPDESNWHKPILAANDAASGVAVMLEIARMLQEDKEVKEVKEVLSPQSYESVPSGRAKEVKDNTYQLNIGVDFVCFDAEDWGTPQWYEGTDPGDTWALGAQYFARNLPEGYEARYGVLLDMVGGQGARFYQEGVSLEYAPAIVSKVWQAARNAGYGSFFPMESGGNITDDHVPLNRTARIPTIDIIPYYPDCQQSSFGPTWHTLSDDMQHIDRNTLKAVGQTLVQLLFTEQAPAGE